ncbi:helix-turn-helix domain-containing protein [Paenibacillus sp. D2_2]|uniref:helix-turn-helix domain-containing protein n=1 Tax=Paenibacillus sp. D2_2 TaxID=3073092 RepID=UPI002816696C|nr:helix-turn-helix domain-containing protein [Paenibacillus sp. D2_2]WMT39607.1 helix-turn-helix domain-containing protein [Paenibacillus sp. D2_2]
MSRQRSMETILTSEFVSIGELVRLTDSRYSTLKFYTEEGMLPFEQAEENLTRRYKREDTVALILMIKELKSNGLSIPQIKEALNMDE